MSELVAGLPILSIVTFLPAAGALLILLSRMSARGENVGYDNGVKLLTLLVTIATFVASLFAFAAFDSNDPNYQLQESIPWAFGASYAMGVDTLAMSLVMLTTFLTPLCILASWVIEKQVSSYMVLFLLLETLMIGVFCAQDIILFYIFFEGGLIPMFILIGVWGGERRVYAAFKFFLYTLLGSLLMLVAIIYMIATAGTSNIPALTEYAQTTGFEQNVQLWLWLAFFASFAVKMPMWPVHTWLPDAHVEAPTAASVVLAAILLKMGGYGFLRFSLPMFPDASEYFRYFVFALSVIAIVWASLVAFRQLDMKKLIAYSSVAHMGFVTMGIFSGNEQGIQGAIFQMLSHGVISGALFLCVGVVYDRMHTREIAFYGGLVNRMPVYAAVFMLFTMGNVGLPGTSGFPGEILTMVGTFQVNGWVAAGAALGVIFSAAYALTLYRKVAFGVIENPKLDKITDLDAREWVTFIPLIVATLIMGLAPAYVLDFTQASTATIVQQFTGSGAMNPAVDLNNSLPLARPELLLAAFALIGAVLGAWFKDRAFGALSLLGVISIAGAGLLALAWSPGAAIEIFQGAMVVDGVGVFAKVLIAAGAAATLALGADYFTITKEQRFEFPVLVALATLGMFVMVSAQDLISLYVGVELQSLAAYVLAAWRRDDARSSEAGLKYFVLSAISSGLLLFGSSFVYGFTGSIRFDAIAAAVGEGAGGIGLLFGLVLMLCALGFKMSAAPFHMWTPDVYEGAPTPITAFFAAAPKVAAVALMARVLYDPFVEMTAQWQQVVAALAAISMVWGSVAALVQTNLKRLMAYSSIGNMGFALMGLAGGGEQGPSSALIYLALYLPTTIGMFALILAMRRDGQPAETVADLAGLAQKRPWMAALFTMLLFSVAGIPPFAGFIGKLAVFTATVDGHLYWLAIVGGLSAVVAAAYYLRLIASIWFAPPAAQLQSPSGTVMVTALASAALTFPVLVLLLGTLQSWAENAVRMSF